MRRWDVKHRGSDHRGKGLPHCKNKLSIIMYLTIICLNIQALVRKVLNLSEVMNPPENLISAKDLLSLKIYKHIHIQIKLYIQL